MLDLNTPFETRLEHFQAKLDATPESISLFLQQQQKHLVFLVSVGQPYHDGQQLKATVDLFYEMFRLWCLYTDPSDEEKSKYKHLYPRHTDYWKVTVLVADTLQAYNEPDPEAVKDAWRTQGESFIKRAKPIFDKFFETSKKHHSVSFDLEFVQWEAVIAHATEHYHFRDYLAHIRAHTTPGLNNELSALHRAVNSKGNRYASIKAGRSDTYRITNDEEKKLKPEWETTELSENAKEYIIEELAILMGCLGEGMYLSHADSNAEILKNPDNLWLVYPAGEEKAFKIARDHLAKFRKEKHWDTGINVIWKSIRIEPMSELSSTELDLLVGLSDQNDRYIAIRNNFEYTMTIATRRAIQVINNRCQIAAEMKQGMPLSFGLPISYYNQRIFVSRPDILFSKIEKKFDGQSTKIFVLAGMGGQGKTSLALDFALQQERPFWFEPSYDKSYKKFALRIGLKKIQGKTSSEICNEVKEWLIQRPGWVLFFDDADNFNSVENHIPESGGLVIITSRSSFWPEDVEVINVTEMSQSQSISLLNNITQSQCSENILRELTNELGFLPLALIQAGAYMKKFNVSAREYYETFKSKPDTYLENDYALGTLFDQKTESGKRIVMKTWEISLKAIKKQYGKDEQPFIEENLLRVCAHINNRAIPKRLLEQWFEIFCDKSTLKLQKMATIERKELLNRALKQLQEVSLIEVAPDGVSRAIAEYKCRRINSLLDMYHEYIDKLAFEESDQYITKVADEEISLHPLLQTTVRIHYKLSFSHPHTHEDAKNLLNRLNEALVYMYDCHDAGLFHRAPTFDAGLFDRATNFRRKTLFPHMQVFHKNYVTDYHDKIKSVEFGILCTMIASQILKYYKIDLATQYATLGFRILILNGYSLRNPHYALADAYKNLFLCSVLARTRDNSKESRMKSEARSLDNWLAIRRGPEGVYTSQSVSLFHYCVSERRHISGPDRLPSHCNENLYRSLQIQRSLLGYPNKLRETEALLLDPCLENINAALQGGFIESVDDTRNFSMKYYESLFDKEHHPFFVHQQYLQESLQKKQEQLSKPRHLATFDTLAGHSVPKSFYRNTKFSLVIRV